LTEFFHQDKGENTALSALVRPEQGTFHHEQEKLIPSSHIPKQYHKIKGLWQNILIATYNIESTRGIRLQEVALEAEKEGVDVLICTATRNNYSGDSHIRNYKVYFEGHGEGGAELFTGLCIMIKRHLLTKNTNEKKWVNLPGRILAIRIKNEVIDITVIAGYAPGDHLPKELRNKFWTTVGKTIGEVPKRSCKILGIDANGHIGRDGMGGVGEKGAERWTNNGHELEKVTNNAQMILLNTQNNCENAGWTWQKRDGTGKGRIYYLAIDRILMSRIKQNKGACDLPKWGTQGAEIDHRPVLAKMGITRLRLVGSAENLGTLTSYRGLDPEKQADDNNVYPINKSYSIAVNLSF
jgi:hypothetical protein